MHQYWWIRYDWFAAVSGAWAAWIIPISGQEIIANIVDIVDEWMLGSVEDDI